MRTTIDRAGRLVIPKTLRDRVGIQEGAVELTVDGAAIRVEALPAEDLALEDGLLVIPASGAPIDDQLVEMLRDADRR
jgi:AbrB family looped-hinge helix DNA binding protein